LKGQYCQGPEPGVVGGGGVGGGGFGVENFSSKTMDLDILDVSFFLGGFTNPAQTST